MRSSSVTAPKRAHSPQASGKGGIPVDARWVLGEDVGEGVEVINCPAQPSRFPQLGQSHVTPPLATAPPSSPPLSSCGWLVLTSVQLLLPLMTAWCVSPGVSLASDLAAAEVLPYSPQNSASSVLVVAKLLVSGVGGRRGGIKDTAQCLHLRHLEAPKRPPPSFNALLNPLGQGELPTYVRHASVPRKSQVCLDDPMSSFPHSS